MKKILLSALLLLCLISTGPVSAQPRSSELSPYEELRYGADLSRVPREPYKTEFELEGYKARPYIPPDPKPSLRPDAASRQRNYSAAPAGPGDRGLKNPRAKVRDRYQTRSTWRNEQRKISERSRIPAPQAPIGPGSPASLGAPGAGPPAFPANRR